MAIVVTDGNPTREVDSTIPEVNLLREAGVEIFVIGIGEEVNPSTLLAIADGQEQNVFSVGDFNDLQDIVISLRDAMCGKCLAIIPTVICED